MWGIREAIEVVGATHLPPYSSDLNLSRKCFIKLKALLRELLRAPLMAF